ncbi:retinol dehydrogenase 14-like [Tropilaelaps mercedesae]|uniref:Retinol dehydrogenase 14-like n=1 Tax=Tropilaelaps mercedesae TaxID=418985 RepID=A0A1V9XL13_9ACAR|nr:retinol dehydrogenase 14-like [Tropilaelaps mercedesae]
MLPFLIVGKGVALGLTLYLVHLWRASRWPVFTKTIDCLDKIFVVTGATSGIGRATAEELALRGGKVILACRNLEQAKKIADYLTGTYKRSRVLAIQLDLSDFDSIDAFCRHCKANLPRIDVLILNAGVAFCPYQETKQGLELQMGVNYFGHVRLTIGLISLLKKSPQSRVVQVSSSLYKRSDLIDRLAALSGEARIEDLCYKKNNYNKSRAYANSKLAGMLFLCQMSRGYSMVRWYSVSPGIVNSNLGRHRSALFYLMCLPLYIPFALAAVRTPWQGCQTVLYAALDDEIDAQYGYYRDCRLENVSSLLMNSSTSEKLFRATQEIINHCDNIAE